MKQELYDYAIQSKDIIVQAVLVAATLILTVVALKVLRRVIAETARKRHLAERRGHIVSKFSQAMVYLIAVAIISNILGFGIQGIFLATSSFFALVGIAFFANWSILSNATASVIMYFAFPYRIGDRIRVEHEPHFCGILRDITLFHIRVETESGSVIAIPANVAIQKIITILSESDYQRALTEAAAAPRTENALNAAAPQR